MLLPDAFVEFALYTTHLYKEMHALLMASRRAEGEELLDCFTIHQRVWTSCDVSPYNRSQLSLLSGSRYFPALGRNSEPSFLAVLCTLAAFAKEMIKPLRGDASADFKEYQVLSVVQGLQRCDQMDAHPHHVPTEKAAPYRSIRKNECTQNVIDVCSFDMLFTWIWPRPEGSAHDFCVFKEATTRPNKNFPHPPQGMNSSCYLLFLT